MKIAFVLTSNGVGGTEYQMNLLRRGLMRSGHQVDVHILEGGNEAAEEDGIWHHYGLQRGHGPRAFWNGLVGCVLLRKRLVQGNYDVIHVAMARAAVMVPLLLKGIRDRPRLVAWRRNLGIHLGRSRFKLLLERAAAGATDCLIFNSHAVREYWHRSGVRSRENVVIPNAVRLDAAETARELPTEEPWMVGNPMGDVRIISVGNLRQVKRHDLLLEAVARFQSSSKRFQGRWVRVIILGEGPEREALEKHARRLDVDLKMPGRVSRVFEWLAASSIYVHSSDSEGSSNAIIEAMLVGLPIVATDAGGTAEALCGTGYVVPCNDPRALAEALTSVMGDESEGAKMGAAARRRASTVFSLESILMAHMRVYEGERLDDYRGALGSR